MKVDVAYPDRFQAASLKIQKLSAAAASSGKIPLPVVKDCIREFFEPQRNDEAALAEALTSLEAILAVETNDFDALPTELKFSIAPHLGDHTAKRRSGFPQRGRRR